MANILNLDRQIAVIGALAEGSSIRSFERITGVHRDTIMRLGVRVGEGCAKLMDRKMRDLPCQRLQLDEIWGFIGKKQRHVRPEDVPQMGDVWTFCAIDAETKLVPAFKVGKRDHVTAGAFVSDLAGRLRNRVQITTDALSAYVGAIDDAFGVDVDYAQVIKTHVQNESKHPERKYSAPRITTSEKRVVMGNPDMGHASTSYIERLNATTPSHAPAGPSDARVQQEAGELRGDRRPPLRVLQPRDASQLRVTPAMEAGIEHDFWTVGQLVEAAMA